ncbi:hypothetical protein [Nostoc sp. PA-18-2419]|uniref:hypothetical protein n=1 Tax=Nostoc sp. PA-18-2419 TaxID=2575443 RepID=UPI00110820CC|nr:hypothetical protein [Nostoc sp. PA-18-2419]
MTARVPELTDECNVQPMQLLIVTDPNTAQVRVFKVSMRFVSAIEAVRWVNQKTNLNLHP